MIDLLLFLAIWVGACAFALWAVLDVWDQTKDLD